ncbi:PREDICTED: uncharacterized protein LOC108618938 isoform X1 [Drosophila arizonae]|uniref:Uncharacterized protein LOC108618938 isoform X1 n=1 Tax=Drosophila arizonae TaxID=7263 RepID=A0ABM1PTX0_DROAR|nr:PREDICTED: uncharacterized protein LOC108618938 isoform X1 [Drosophila arizonae]
MATGSNLQQNMICNNDNNNDNNNNNRGNNNWRLRRLKHFMDLLPVGGSVSSKSLATSQQQQQQQQRQHEYQQQQQQQRHQEQQHQHQHQQQQQQQQHPTLPCHSKDLLAMANAQLNPDAVAERETLNRSASYHSEELLLHDLLAETELANGHRIHKDDFGTQRVYKKTSPNCVITLYLPTREIILSGNNPSVLRGIVYVDPKAIQGYRVYAQLTLTFRYGREDEEVMGLRFCNEAIMSLHQIWPRLEEPSPETLSPLQEALLKRLGDGAHPFTLSLTAQAPPSVQLVPAKRYYGAPIGTSYDVRCFIADKTDEKFHRRASVKMGVRVIYRTDVFHQHTAPENFAAFAGQNSNASTQSPPASATPPLSNSDGHEPTPSTSSAGGGGGGGGAAGGGGTGTGTAAGAGAKGAKSKSERGDSFPKLRLSPKAFRFSGRFGRSKSEIERCPNDPFHCYSKSFQEHCDNTGSEMLPPHSNAGVTGGIGGISVGPCGGPQGAVDKPFLLHDGRVGLRASLDKGWYTHGEDVNVTVNIRNDSRKTVRKVRVCAIQHVDVCMFNNGKFKNVVADSENISPAVDRTVPPGGTLNTTVALRPQRGPTKNWIALEDTLQRSTEPDEITGAIAASAIRSPNFVMQAAQLLTGHPLASPAMAMPQPPSSAGTASAGGAGSGLGDDRNVFAIYVSYYVKVKLTLSGMGGELSLKLPFVLVHVDESLRPGHTSATVAELRMERLTLQDVPAGRKSAKRSSTMNKSSNTSPSLVDGPSTSAAAAAAAAASAGVDDITQLDVIEAADEEFNICVPVPTGPPKPSSSSQKRRLQRSETLARDIDETEEEQEVEQQQVEQHVVQVHLEQLREEERPQPATETGAVPKTTNV